MYRVFKSSPQTERTGETTWNSDGEAIRWHRVTGWIELGTAQSYEEARAKFGGRPVLERIPD